MDENVVEQEMQNWQENNPQSATTVEAPEKPCFKCQAAREAIDKVASALVGQDVPDEEQKKRFRGLLYKTAYERLAENKGGKIVLVTDEGCAPCTEVTELLNPFIEKGAIEVLPYNKCSADDKNCIASQGIKAVPVLCQRGPDGKCFETFYPLAGPSTWKPIPQEG